MWYFSLSGPQVALSPGHSVTLVGAQSEGHVHLSFHSTQGCCFHWGCAGIAGVASSELPPW